MAEEVGIQLKVRDRTTFSRDMRTAADDVTQFGTAASKDAAAAVKQLGATADAATSKLKNIASGMKTFGNRATVGVTLPLIALGRSANLAAREAALGQADLAAVLEATGGAAGVTVDSVNKLAASIAKTTLHEDDAVVSAAAMLATFKNVKNLAGENKDMFDQTVMSLADMSAFMRTDMKSSAIQLGKAMNEPAKAASALSRNGTVAKADIEALQKMAERGAPIWKQQAFLLEAINKQVGGVARDQAATDAGKQMQATKELNEAMESLGTSLAPALADLADSLVPLLKRFSELPGSVQTAIFAIGLGVGPVVRLGGGILGLVANMKKLRTASTAAQGLSALGTAGTAASGGLSAATSGLGAAALAAAPVAGVVAAAAGSLYMVKKATDAWSDAQDAQRESTNNSWALSMAYWKAVKSGRMTIDEYRRKVEILASEEGIAAEESARLRNQVATLSAAFEKNMRNINGVNYSVERLIKNLRGVPRNVSSTISIETIRTQTLQTGSGKLPAGVTARAQGGPVTALKPYLVGERGPELVVPKIAGDVIPNDLLEQVSRALAVSRSSALATEPHKDDRDRRPLVIQLMLDRKKLTDVVIDDIDDRLARF